MVRVTIFDDAWSAGYDEHGNLTALRIGREGLNDEDRADPRWAAITSVWCCGPTLPLDDVRRCAPNLRVLGAVYQTRPFEEEDEEGYMASLLAAGDLRLETLIVGVCDMDGIARRTLEALDGPGPVPRFPALRAFGVRAFSAPAARASWILALPVIRRVERVRIANGLGVASIAAWLPHLGALPATVRSFEVSFDHGWAGWSVEVSRDDDGAFTAWRLSVAPRADDRFPKVALVEVKDLLDELSGDAVTSFTLRAAKRVRATKADLAKIVSELGRMQRLPRAELPLLGDLVIAHTRPAAMTPAAAQAIQAEQARVAAFERLRAAAADPAIDEPLRAALSAVNEEESTWTAASDALDAAARATKQPTRALAEVALRAIELPLARWARSDLSGDALVFAALRVLERAPQAGTARRLIAVFEREDGCRWSVLTHQRLPAAVVPAGELGALLDWYESLPDGRFPLAARRLEIFSGIKQLVIASGDGETWDDVHARREDPARKLTKFKRGVYDSILEGLAKRATRGGS